MDAVSLLRQQVAQAHQWLNTTIGDVSTEQAHWCETRGIMPVSAQYAHTVLAEDFILNSIVRGTQPLMMSSWAGKVGISEPPPFGDWGGWARTVQVDLDQLREYAAAVYAETDAYLATLSEADLDREVDTAPLSMGVVPLAVVLSVLAGHPYMHAGEISAIKGLQGLKGYPV